MKDATNGDTLRAGVSNLLSVDFRMRKLTDLKDQYHICEGTPRELKHLST